MRFNRKSLKLIAPPVIPLVSVQDMKDILKIDGDADDCRLALYIESAIDAMEKYTRRAFITRTFDLTMDGFSDSGDEAMARLGAGTHELPVSYFQGGADEFDLPYPPILSITSIKTRDVDNTETTVDSSTYRLDGDGGRVYLNISQIWPGNLRGRAAIVVRFKAGYGDDPSMTPAAIRGAVRDYVAQMYQCSGSCGMSDTCKSALDGYKLYDEMGML